MKIAHIADCHLRDRQYMYNSRGRDFFLGLKNAVEEAIRLNADVIVCAGDLFDVSRPSPSNAVENVRKIEEICRAGGKKFLVTSGNHDITCNDWMKAHGDYIVGLDDKDYVQNGIRIHGIPYCSPEELRQKMAALDDNIDVLVWHGEIKDFGGYPKADAVAMADFPENKFKLIAMGHIHIHKYIKRESDGLVIAYPGSTELGSDSEEFEKKFYMYDFDEETHEIKSITSCPFKTRQVQEFVVKTEKDLDEAVQKIAKGSIVILKYSNDVKNVMRRFYAAMHKDNILHQQVIPSSGKTVDRTKLKETITSPVEFVKNNIGSVMKPDVKDRIGSLCALFIDSNADYKHHLDKYCEERLGGKIII